MTEATDPDAITYIDLPPASRLFGAAAATSDGWTIPVEGRLTSYLYVTASDIAFEIWLGGDWDITVRLEGEFTLRHGTRSQRLDPRNPNKSELTPILAINDLTVAGVRVRAMGRLEIVFQDDWDVVVEPSETIRAWVMSWPVEGAETVACPAGGGVRVGHVDDSAPADAVVEDVPPVEVQPVVVSDDAAEVALPIRGVIARCSASSESIELAVPIVDGNEFDMHFRGAVSVIGPTGDWTGEARGAHVLGLVGALITASTLDGDQRLHLRFLDGRELIASPGDWEAHWPEGADGDDCWLPEPGPRIP